MTDRALVYQTAIPQATDLLKTSKFAMLGDAFLALATLGNNSSNPSTVVSGLECTPTTPASLQVNVAPGSIFSMDTTDVSSYGDLGTDTTQIFKMGIRPTTGTLTVNPPTTVGFSQVYLVQAILSNVDSEETTLSYYNSSNPALPYSGPSNSGTKQFTERKHVCTVALKAGVAAATGSQVTPSPDAGYIALYAITVTNGQTQINSSHITTVNGGYAPFVKTALPYIPSESQSGKWVYAEDTSTTINVIAVTLYPTPSSYVAGFSFKVKMVRDVTGPATININGLGVKTIVKSGGAALSGGEWAAGDIVEFRYDGNNFQGMGAGFTTSRPALTSPKTVYVNNSTGNDSTHDGSQATVSGGKGPFKTLARALTAMSNHNLNGYDFTISLADGTYSTASTISLPTPNGSGDVYIVGNETTPLNVVIINTGSGTALVVGGGRYFLKGMYVEATSGGHGIWASGTAVAWCANISCGGCPGGAHFCADVGAFLGINGTVRIYGSAQYHLYASANGTIVPSAIPQPALAVMSSVTFTAAFVQSIGSSFVSLNYSSITYGSGVTVTGVRYQASWGGIIDAAGHGTTWPPGSIAGSTTSGGQYA